jgi:MoxR-like ATPase
MFGASNELPEGKELEALFDRFALRFQVDYLLRPQHLKSVLTAPEPKLATVLNMKTLRAAQAEVAKVQVTDATVDALIAIRDACKAEGILASDRRWKKSLRLVQAASWLAGEKQTSPEELMLLVDALWREPKERPKVARLVGRLADPVSLQATEVLDAARESADKVAALKAGDRRAYIAQAAQALESFTQQMQKLQKLEKSAGRRAKESIALTSAVITAMHEEVARSVAGGLGLRRAGT